MPLLVHFWQSLHLERTGRDLGIFELLKGTIGVWAGRRRGIFGLDYVRSYVRDCALVVFYRYVIMCAKLALKKLALERALKIWVPCIQNLAYHQGRVISWMKQLTSRDVHLWCFLGFGSLVWIGRAVDSREVKAHSFEARGWSPGFLAYLHLEALVSFNVRRGWAHLSRLLSFRLVAGSVETRKKVVCLDFLLGPQVGPQEVTNPKEDPRRQIIIIIIIMIAITLIDYVILYYYIISYYYYYIYIYIYI